MDTLSKGKKKDLGERLGLHLMAVIFLYIPPEKNSQKAQKKVISSSKDPCLSAGVCCFLHP